MNTKKRGLSPVIATVLLIAIVVIIGLIIFLWFKGMTEERVTKFGGENIKLVCDKVQFDAQYTGGKIYISNIGNVPIYSFQIDIFIGGDHEAQAIESLDATWPATGLDQGEAFPGTINANGADKIRVIPILIGESEEGDKTYICEESRSILELFL